VAADWIWERVELCTFIMIMIMVMAGMTITNYVQATVGASIR
jgi:hypothetical protein